MSEIHAGKQTIVALVTAHVYRDDEAMGVAWEGIETQDDWISCLAGAVDIIANSARVGSEMFGVPLDEMIAGLAREVARGEV